jgi:hypothetical protein
MRLSDLFRPSTPKESNTGVTSGNGAKSALINRQIRALVPGQTIQGEVTAKSGNEVQIKLAPEVVISARLSKDVNLEVGKPVLFQVKNNGSSLTLQPLFTNLATDANVLKALEQALIPVNDTTANMAEAMMKAGLSIDKQSLMQVFREISQFPQSSPEDVVDLRRLGLPVTEENLSQVVSYKNLTYQLTGGLEQLGKEIPLTLSGLIQDGESQKGLELLKSLVDMQIMDGLEGGKTSAPGLGKGTLTGEGSMTTIRGESRSSLQGSLPGSVTEGTDALSKPGGNEILLRAGGAEALLRTGGAEALLHAGGAEALLRAGGAEALLRAGGAEALLRAGGAEALLHTGSTEALLHTGDTGALLNTGQGKILGDAGDSMTLRQSGSEYPQGVTTGEKNETAIKDNQTTAIFRDTGETLEQLTANLHLKLSGWEEGTIETGEVFAALKQLLAAADGKSAVSTRMLETLIKDPRLSNLFQETMLEQLALRPEAVQDKENIGKLYDRWQHQMQTLSETLEQNGLTATSLSKTVDNLNQNLNFLNQMNQLYQYVQIPLKMMEQTAHGDLYVYSNKKNLAATDGSLSALLHLDMEHLGPVDIYVSLEASKVNTHFYVQEDSMLDFMMEHIHVLNERLQEKGYDAKCELTVKDAPGENPIENILAEHSQTTVKTTIHQGFDVRA